MMDQMVEWVKLFVQTEGSKWLLFSISLLFSLFLLFTLKRLLWKRITEYTISTSTKFDDLLLKHMEAPIQLLLTILSISIANKFSPQLIRDNPDIIHGLKIAIILSIIWIVDRIISTFFHNEHAPNSLSGNARTILFFITRIFFIILGILVILDTLGISITPILASLGVGTIAVALALQDTLNNFFSGIYLLIDRPIRIGDFVSLEGDTSGTVTKIGWRSTQILIPSNNTVIIPNSKISNARIINYNYPSQEISLTIPLRIGFDNNLSIVENIVIETMKKVLRNTQGTMPEVEPIARYDGFIDMGLQLTVTVRCKQFSDQFLIKHEFIKAIHEQFQREKIEIPFTQRMTQEKEKL